VTGTTHVFTAAAANYLGKVRTLFRSVSDHHPEFVCHLLLPEHPDGIDQFLGDAEPFDEVALVSDLPNGTDPSWLFRYSIVEMATAIKAPYAQHLLDRPDCSSVLYLDPDIVVFSRLDDVLEALGAASIALTPHLLEPEDELQAIMDNEMAALKHGAFNLGFFGVRDTPQGRGFLRWWAARTERFCFDDTAQGLFTDQKWVDLAPGFFDEVAILRSPRLNVAPWNLGRRDLTGSFDEGFRVGSEPLGFYHFTGFDSGAHRTMAERYAPDPKAVMSLIDWYEQYSHSLAPDPLPPWSFGTYDDGTPIEREHRRLFRSRPDLEARFPDPFKTGARSYKHFAEAVTLTG
jgi:hypothetical protein